MSVDERHVIFDLDGTVIDSREEIIRTYHLVFQKIIPAKSPDTETINPGATLNQVLEAVYEGDHEKARKAKSLFASMYDQSDYLDTTLYADVVETLAELRKKGYQLYVATNKRYAPTIRILQKKKIADYFAGTMASEMEPGTMIEKHQMVASLKAKFLFSAGYMVGDMTSDIEAGNKEKLTTIAVTYGYGNKDALRVANPTFLIDSFKGILNIL